MNYYFSTSDLILTCTNCRRTIVSDSINVHIAKFSFDSMWDGFSKTATFTNSKTGTSINMTLSVTDECVIPWESLVADKEGGNLIVCIQGVKDDKKMYTYMNKAFPLIITLSDESNGTNPIPPTQSVYDQIMAILVTLNISTEPISDLETTNDNKLATIGQIKAYVNSKLI